MPRPVNSYGAAPLYSSGVPEDDRSRRAAAPSQQPSSSSSSRTRPSASSARNDSKRHMSRLGLETGRASEPETRSPRTRDRHAESSGDSDSGSPTTLYRSLRPDERPFERGLLPPSPHDADITARMHVEKGSKLKVPSAYVSATRSMKTAAAWAGREEGGRVARFTNPSRDREVYDLTNPEHQDEVFGDSRTPARNFAKGSQEVVIKHGVPPENIRAVYDARAVSEAAYQAAKNNPPDGMYKQIKSRSKVQENKVKTRPTPVQLYEVARPGRSSGSS